jgi:hypothetical protein
MKYVSLGDSYSSGTGTRIFYEPTCRRSVYAYPYGVHTAHPNWTFVDAACSGATTIDILHNQVGSITADTTWVSYTGGGNDAEFTNVMEKCAIPILDCNGAIDEAQTIISDTLPARLDLLNNQIKSRAPNAKVLVLDYPHIFNGTDCNALTSFSPAEQTRLNQTADLMRDALSAAAVRAGSKFIFKDVIPRFVGHAVCDGGSGSSTEWINGLSSPQIESFHPKATGHGDGYYYIAQGVIG